MDIRFDVCIGDDRGHLTRLERRSLPLPEPSLSSDGAEICASTVESIELGAVDSEAIRQIQTAVEHGKEFVVQVFVMNPVAHLVYGAVIQEAIKGIFEMIRTRDRRKRPIKAILYGPDRSVLRQVQEDK